MSKEINNLQDVYQRLKRLEEAVFSPSATDSLKVNSKRAPSLAELMKKNKLSNGQEKVAAIVGYIEKIKGQAKIAATDIKAGWREGKLDGSFASVLVTRAVKDGFINDYDNKGAYTLTQTGEKFWDKFYESGTE